jgi:flagellar FliL protein
MAKAAAAPRAAEAASDSETPVVAPKAARFGKRQLILFGAPLLLAGVGAGLWFSGILPHLLGMGASAHKEVAEAPVNPVFVDLPEMIANLNGNPHRPSYIKVTVRLEVARTEDADRVRASMPRLQDLFQTYLREMRPEELRGSAGTYRLHEELLLRANAAVAPTRVKDVLFTQMLVQ